MRALGIDVPHASRYVSNKIIDDIAQNAVQVFRSKNPERQGSAVDVEAFVDLLEVSLLWDDIEEPEGAAFFANFCGDDDGLITINERHREFFEGRPDVYSAGLGHEVGHCVLRHWEKGAIAQQSLSLFPELAPSPQLFHKSSWLQYGLTRDEVQKLKESDARFKQTLAKSALLSTTARETLQQLNDHFEPEWMFWQAEYFSLCLRIPRDKLESQLEEGWNFNSWSPIYRLAERFKVSASMMRMRLEKLGLIEIGPDNRPRPLFSEVRLFR